MTLTLLDIYNECAGQPWSMFDNDAESVEDFESALKISINKATSYLWNYQPWSFRMSKNVIRTRSGKNDYSIPDGLITRKTVDSDVKYGVKYKGKSLEYVDDPDTLEQEETGEPTSFWIEGENFYLYPMPDNAYTIEIDYLLLPYGLNENEEYIYELTKDTDYINIPEKYEKMFRNCLISLAMLYAIADESDENYSGYKRQYEDALATLFKYCRDKIRNRRITW